MTPTAGFGACPRLRRCLADVVERADVRMVQRGDRLRLALKPLAELVVPGQRRRDHLDGDVAVQARVTRPVDLSHAAGAERRDDLVRPDPRSGKPAHEVGRIQGSGAVGQSESRRSGHVNSICRGPGRDSPVSGRNTRDRSSAGYRNVLGAGSSGKEVMVASGPRCRNAPASAGCSSVWHCPG